MALSDLPAKARKAVTPLNALHLLLFTLSLTLAFGCFDGSLFGWHPFSMSLAYLFFMAEGLIAAWSIRPAVSDERVRGLETHVLMQLRALMFAAIGAGVIIHNKNRNGKPHFQTLHGKVRLFAAGGVGVLCGCSGCGRSPVREQHALMLQPCTIKPLCRSSPFQTPKPHTPPRPQITHDTPNHPPTPPHTHTQKSPPNQPPPQLGLLTLILTGLSPLLGAVSFRKLGLIHRFPEAWHPRLKKAHRALGAVTWGAALLSVEVALPHRAVYKVMRR